MKKLFVVLMVVLMSSVSYAADTKCDIVKTYETKQGTVVFDHKVHMKMNFPCDVCHAFFTGGVDKDNAHKACKSCHQKNGGPTKCGECHKK